MTLLNIFIFLAGIYEPSAIQQLPDGRFLVVEDEKKHPFSLVTINPDGSVATSPLSPGLKGDDDFWKLDDLEGLALDGSGYLYALTSHSRDGDGDEKKSRNKLVRFRLEGDRVVSPSAPMGRGCWSVSAVRCSTNEPSSPPSKIPRRSLKQASHHESRPNWKPWISEETGFAPCPIFPSSADISSSAARWHGNGFSSSSGSGAASRVRPLAMSPPLKCRGSS
ncbi:MAG: hypothetical protein JZU63_07635, partial [Rhodoferax sp.]|nr:hypothetical protein [Rhodoferax sp.]